MDGIRRQNEKMEQQSKINKLRTFGWREKKMKIYVMRQLFNNKMETDINQGDILQINKVGKVQKILFVQLQTFN